MINIDELRQRVEAAEQRFGMIDSSQRRYSERLIGMMNAVEEDLAQKQVQFEENKALISAMSHENQQLRSMLHTLLLAIEAAGNDQTAEIMRQIDGKLAAIVETKAPASEGEVQTAETAAPAVAPQPAAAPADMVTEEVAPVPPGILPTAVSAPPVPTVPMEDAADDSAAAPADDTATSNGEDVAAGSAGGVREILQRMTKEAAQQEGAASGQP